MMNQADTTIRLRLDSLNEANKAVQKNMATEVSSNNKTFNSNH